MGVPVPGETAMVAASLLAAAGHLSLVMVIVVATLAGAVGDNVGYAIGGAWGAARRPPTADRCGTTAARRWSGPTGSSPGTARGRCSWRDGSRARAWRAPRRRAGPWR